MQRSTLHQQYAAIGKRPLVLHSSSDKRPWTNEHLSLQLQPDVEGVPSFMRLIKVGKQTRERSAQTLGAAVRVPADCCTQTTMGAVELHNLEVRVEQLEDTEEQLHERIQEQTESAVDALREQRMLNEEQLEMLRESHRREASGSDDRHAEELNELTKKITELQLDKEDAEASAATFEQQAMLEEAQCQELQLELVMRERDVASLKDHLSLAKERLEDAIAQGAKLQPLPDEPEDVTQPVEAAWEAEAEAEAEGAEKASDTIQRRIDEVQSQQGEGVATQRVKGVDLKSRMGQLMGQIQIEKEQNALRKAKREIDAQKEELQEQCLRIQRASDELALSQLELSEQHARMDLLSAPDEMLTMAAEHATGQVALLTVLLNEKQAECDQQVAQSYTQRFRHNVRLAKASHKGKEKKEKKEREREKEKESDQGSTQDSASVSSLESADMIDVSNDQVQDLLVQLVSNEVIKYGLDKTQAGEVLGDAHEVVEHLSGDVLTQLQNTVLNVFGDKLQRMRDRMDDDTVSLGRSSVLREESTEDAPASRRTSHRKTKADKNKAPPANEANQRCRSKGSKEESCQKETQTASACVGITPDDMLSHCESAVRDFGLRKAVFKKKRLQTNLRPAYKSISEESQFLGLITMKNVIDTQPTYPQNTGKVVRSYLFSGHPTCTTRVSPAAVA